MEPFAFLEVKRIVEGNFMTTQEKVIRKEQITAVFEIIGNYKNYKVKLIRKETLSKTRIAQYQRYLRKVDYAINKLSPTIRDVFEKTYIEDNFFEILTYYSMSQYYRLRKRAYEEFLELFKKPLRA